MLTRRPSRRPAEYHISALILLAGLSAAQCGRTLVQTDTSPSPSPALLGAPGPNGVPHGVLVYTTPPPADDTLVSTGPSAEPSSPVFYADPPLSPLDAVNSISADDLAAAAQSEGSNKSWIAGVVIGVVVLVAIAVGVCVIARRRRRAATRFHELQSTEMSFRDADF